MSTEQDSLGEKPKNPLSIFDEFKKLVDERMDNALKMISEKDKLTPAMEEKARKMRKEGKL